MTVPESANRSGPHLEANKGDLHREDGSQAVDRAIGYVDPVGEASGQHQHKNMQGDEVNQKDVATPRGDLPRERNKQKNPQVPGLTRLREQRSNAAGWVFPGSRAGFSPSGNASRDPLALRAPSTVTAARSPDFSTPVIKPGTKTPR